MRAAYRSEAIALCGLSALDDPEVEAALAPPGQTDQSGAVGDGGDAAGGGHSGGG